jgi:tRNA (guanine37-N1)-methyltransferase
MRIDVFTIFPEFLAGPIDVSLLGRARVHGLIDVRLHDPRAFTTDRHRSVDDAPMGGGPGMVMMPGPLFAAVEAVEPPRPLFLLTPGGRRFDQELAVELAATGGFSLLCGRYEGVDQRVADHLCDGELSVGDYVLAGGEAAALVVIEAVARLVPGVLGNDESADDESFTGAVLEHPQYTRPADFRGHLVPEVLRSGDHHRIARWRRTEALKRTFEHRPDLLARLSDDDRRLLGEAGIGVPVAVDDVASEDGAVEAPRYDGPSGPSRTADPAAGAEDERH